MKTIGWIGVALLGLVGYQMWQTSKETGSLSSSGYFSTINPWIFGGGGVALLILGTRKE